MIKKGILFGAFFCICIFAHAQFLLKKIEAGCYDCTITQMTDVNRGILFLANDSVYGSELWRSDGTPTGTYRLTDLNKGAGGSAGGLMWKWGDTTFWGMSDGGYKVGMWRMIGTSGQPEFIKAFKPLIFSAYYESGSAVIGHSAIFVAGDSAHGTELWISDGTDSGTRLLKDINPGIAGSTIRRMYAFQDKVFFAADDKISGIGEELWVTDGTPSGTKLIRDIYLGKYGSYASQFVPFKGELYFRAQDDFGLQVWKTDGYTVSKASMLTPRPWGAQSLTVCANKLFFSADDGSFGAELWATEGTVPTTYLVRDIDPGSNGSYPDALVAVKNKLFFYATSLNKGTELWSSDGSIQGTVRVLDINPGAASSYPYKLIEANGLLYFTALDGIHGYEFWVSDGTAVGTKMLNEINPGSTGINVKQVQKSGDYIFFIEGKNYPFNKNLYAIYVKDTTQKDSTAAILPINKTSFQIFPNPTGDEINIVLPSGSYSNEIVIYDAMGREVLRDNRSFRDFSGSVKLSVAAIPCGVYSMQIGNTTRRMIIQR